MTSLYRNQGQKLIHSKQLHKGHITNIYKTYTHTQFHIKKFFTQK